MTGSTALPVVDVSAWMQTAASQAEIAAMLAAALERDGFAYVRGLPVSDRVLREAFAMARRFFRAPEAVKRRFSYADIDANFGYQGLEGERLDPTALPDLKETFTMRNVAAMASQPLHWPDEDFRCIASELQASTFQAAQLLLRIVAASLELPTDFFVARHTGENVTLRLLHYPGGVVPRDASQIGAGAHTDYGSLTLLFQDSAGGLEIRDAEGKWRAAPPLPDCVLVNTGDLMARWTNGRYRSTPHRVRRFAQEQDRQSIALFVDPDSQVQVECLPCCRSPGQGARDPSIAAGDYIRAKIAATHEVRT